MSRRKRDTRRGDEKSGRRKKVIEEKKREEDGGIREVIPDDIALSIVSTMAFACATEGLVKSV